MKNSKTLLKLVIDEATLLKKNATKEEFIFLNESHRTS